MKRTIYHFAFALVVLSACNNEPQKEVLDLPSIRPSFIYNFDSVSAFNSKHWSQNVEAAAAYFKKGADEAETNPRKAIWFYKRAITLNPLPEYYHTLGQALLDNKNYKEANTLYSLVVQSHYIRDGHGDRYDYLWGTPSEDDYYRMLLSCILAYDYVPGYEIARARENGVDPQKLKQRLMAEGRVHYDTASTAYKDFVNHFLSDEERLAYAANPANFRAFVSGIKDTGLTYEIPLSNVADFNYRNYTHELDEEDLSAHTLEMNFLKQKQDLPDQWFKYNTKHTAPVNDSVVYVIYSIDTSDIASPRPMRHVGYWLVTFDRNGKIIDSKSIAWQSGEWLAQASVSNNSIRVKTYKRKWRLPYSKHDYDNEVLKTEQADEFSLLIEPDGKITAAH